MFARMFHGEYFRDYSTISNAETVSRFFGKHERRQQLYSKPNFLPGSGLT